MAAQRIYLDGFQLRRSDKSVRLVYATSSNSPFKNKIKCRFSTSCVLFDRTNSILTIFDRNCSNLTSLYYVDVGFEFRGPTSTYSMLPPIYSDASLGPYIETWSYVYNPCYPTMSVPTVCLSSMSIRGASNVILTGAI